MSGGLLKPDKIIRNENKIKNFIVYLYIVKTGIKIDFFKHCKYYIMKPLNIVAS